MPYFIILINWTDKGLANAKDSPNRLEGTKKRIDEMGGKLHQFFFTIGQYDSIAITEFPSDEVFMQFLLAFGAQGNVRRTALKAWTDEAAAKFFSAVE